MLQDVRKELAIIQRHKENKTSREIAKELHVSLRDIGPAIRKYEAARQLLISTGDIPDTIESSNAPRGPTIVDAFKRFIVEADLVKVLIELNVEDPDLLKRWYAQFQDLRGLGVIMSLYQKIGGERATKLNDFLFKLEKEGISNDELIERAKDIKDAPGLRMEVRDLREERNVLESELPSKRVEHKSLIDQNIQLEKEKSKLLNSITDMEEYYEMISELIWHTEQGAGRQQAVKIIEDVAEGQLASTSFGYRALIGVRNAIGRNPERMKLLAPYKSNSPYYGLTGNFPRELEVLAQEVAEEITSNESRTIATEAIAKASASIRSQIRPRFPLSS